MFRCDGWFVGWLRQGDSSADGGAVFGALGIRLGG